MCTPYKVWKHLSIPATKVMCDFHGSCLTTQTRMSATATNNGSGSLIMERGFMSLVKEQLGWLYWGAVDVRTTTTGLIS